MRNEPPYRIRAAGNLVVVRVVVRDSQGKPVENLRKEDFKLFDRGREQSIAQFAVESPATVSSSSTRPGAHAPGQAASLPSAAVPGRFLAFYFDDLNTSDTDMVQVRTAADHYLAGNLQLNDRVAIFTSTQMLCGFTADPKQIHDALLKLHASRASIRQCPDISDYQAQEITDTGGNPADDAMKIALDEAVRQCHMSETNALQVIPAMAKSIVDEAQILARTSLQGLERMVQYMSEMPGERTIVLVSPGFPSRSEQRQLDRIIGRALRSQVVISSLDPKGLALLMRAADATRAYAPGGPLMLAQQTLDSAREAVATDVLAEVAQGTGGEFFHNNNDLKAGFGALTGSATCYILGFTPTDMKPDGKFHALKVALTEKQKGMSIRARRGYFAPTSEAEADAEAKENKAFDAEAEAQEQIGEAILSKAEILRFPIALNAKLSGGHGEELELSLAAHLDARLLHFHKEGAHNLNTVTFVSAVFDQEENLVDSKQRRFRVSVLDSQLPGFFKAGIDADVTFELKPGSYRIREIVTDSEDRQMTAFSYNVKIPSGR
jgi:VWFA-related protein